MRPSNKLGESRIEQSREECKSRRERGGKRGDSTTEIMRKERRKDSKEIEEQRALEKRRKSREYEKGDKRAESMRKEIKEQRVRERKREKILQIREFEGERR